jgi:hypothetical protein
MSDEPHLPGEPHLPSEPGDDARDERRAALLQTEPLDDVTRARLVRNAMAASEGEAAPQAGRVHPSSARVRWLAVAAAVVALVVAGIAVLARNDSGSAPTAARAPKTVQPQSGASVAPNAIAENGDSVLRQTVGPVSLGDLGDVGNKANLRRAVAAATATADTAFGATTASPTESATAVGVPACPTTGVDRLGQRVAVGSGTVDGAPVTVYVVARKDGSRAAVIVRADCAVGDPVPL